MLEAYEASWAETRAALAEPGGAWTRRLFSIRVRMLPPEVFNAARGVASRPSPLSKTG